MENPKIAAITFGCKVNQYETACIVDDFLENGFQKTNFDDSADVYLINSCTVTNRTDHKSRSAIRKALKFKTEFPQKKIIVTGCFAQREKKQIEKLGAVDLIIDNNHKSQIIKYFQKQKKAVFQEAHDFQNFDEISTFSMSAKTRAFIKIQDGCDYFCSYCAIPFARGHSRSRKKKNILDQIKVLTQKGFQEFVLGGINLGLFGKEKADNYFLADLLVDIEKIDGVKLIRLSSIEPELFSPEILSFMMHSKKLCPHFHIPLQSGSDRLLRKMRRRYSTTEFQRMHDRILHILPEAALGFDVITGLPGESDEHFSETFNFLQNLDFTYLHVFPYSKRKKTKAANMKDQVNGKIVKIRSQKLLKLSSKKIKEYRQKLISQETELCGIVEKKENGYWTALSDHYLRIHLAKKNKLSGKLICGKANSQSDDGVIIGQGNFA